jgi:hypothetical protein
LDCNGCRNSGQRTFNGSRLDPRQGQKYGLLGDLAAPVELARLWLLKRALRLTRGLFERVEMEPTMPEPPSASSDRRKQPPIVAELRRHLHEADRALFETRASSTRRSRRAPTIVAGVVGPFGSSWGWIAIAVVVAGTALYLNRGNNAPVASPPSSATAAPVAAVQSTAPLPESAAPLPESAVPLPTANVVPVAPLPTTGAASVAGSTHGGPRPRSVRVAAKRGASARTSDTVRGKRAPRPTKTQKPKHRRFFGLHFSD